MDNVNININDKWLYDYIEDVDISYIKWVNFNYDELRVFLNDNYYDDEENVYEKDLTLHQKEASYLWIGVDYGTTNPLAALKVYDDGSTLWVENEYYFNSREEGFQKTDEQYCNDLDEWMGSDEENAWIVDPSAASFIQALRARGRRVIEADNEVLDGIRMVSTLIGKRRLKVNKRCVNLLKEINGYVWDESSVNGKERPLKFNDHACDSLRYVVKTKVNLRRLLNEEQ
jgi:PBSX family phage terminase large subunit